MSQNAQITHKKVDKRNKRHKGVKIMLSSFNLFFETTGPIGTKLGRNVHWKVLFCIDRKYTKERTGPKVSKRVLYVELLFFN